MDSIDQIATKANDEMTECKEAYRTALQAFNNSKAANESLEKQKEFFRDFRNKAIEFFNCVENSISSTELSGAFKSDFWAKDLSATASNVLDNIAKFYEKYSREANRLGLNNLVPSKNAYSAMQSVVATYNRDEVEELKKRFIALKLPVRGFNKSRKMNKRYSSLEKLALFITPVVFLLIMVAIGLWNKSYTPEGFWIFRVVLAVIAGAFTAVAIPGSFTLEGKIGNFAIKAVGAIAITVLIYVLNPPALVKHTATTPPTEGETSAL